MCEEGRFMWYVCYLLPCHPYTKLHLHPKSLWMVTAAMKLKDAFSLEEKSMTRNII